MQIDFNTITPTNLLILVVALIILIPLLSIIIKKLHIAKLGPIEIEHSGQATNAIVMRELEDLDTQLRGKVWSMTRQLIRPPKSTQCSLGRMAVREAIMNPLQERTICNHFTSRLTPSTIDDYRSLLLQNIKDYYEDIYEPSACPSGFVLIPWIEVSAYYTKLVDEWLNRIEHLVMQTCNKKIEIYKDALKATTNSYWEDVFKECKQKNEQYIENIKQLLRP